QITLTVTGAPKSLIWTGAAGSTWDVGASGPLSWSDNGGATTDERFFNLDTVTFGDGPTNRNITLTGPLTPAAITVNNSAGNDYSFAGGSIGDSGFVGGTLFTKSGTGKITLNTPTSYAGLTAIQNGTLVLGPQGNLPTGTNLTMGSGS